MDRNLLFRNLEFCFVFLSFEWQNDYDGIEDSFSDDGPTCFFLAKPNSDELVVSILHRGTFSILTNLSDNWNRISSYILEDGKNF